MRQRLDEQGRQDVALHGIEPAGSNSASLSLLADEITQADQPNRRYGGSAVRKIGNQTFAICRHQENIALWQVSEDEVDEVTELYERDRADLWRQDTPNYEPTTLVAVAGLKKVALAYPDEHIIVLGTGHNDTLWPLQKGRAVGKI
jgi:threonine dehydratase